MKKIFLSVAVFNLICKISLAQIFPISFSFSGNTNGLNHSGYVTTGINDGATLTKDQFGRSDKAYYFDGKSKITVNFNPPQDAYGYSVWIYPEPKQTNTIISWQFKSENNFYEPFSISIQDKKLVLSDVYVSDGKKVSLKSDQVIEFNKWHHIVGIKDGNQLKLFINGKFDSNLTLTKDTFGRVVNSFYIGAGTDSTDYKNWFKGKIDDLKIYSEPPSLDEIQTLYEEKPDTLEDDEEAKLPTIEMLNPEVAQDSTITTFENKITLTGLIPDKFGIREVMINGYKAFYDETYETFNKEIKLKEGTNLIKITAINGDEKKGEYSFKINRSSLYSSKDLEPFIEPGKRIALVIGNAAYTKAKPLSNPVNDAVAMKIELEKLGFEVMHIYNGQRNAIRDSILAFCYKLSKDQQTTGLFFYAGHGIEVKGKNYIVPVDGNPKNEDIIGDECNVLEDFLERLKEAKNNLNIVILDACRTDPFRDINPNTGALTNMKIGKGIFIAYSTAPGAPASDGEGKNSLYTQELVNQLRVPNQKLEDVFKNTTANVFEKSGEKQAPWDHKMFFGNFWFNVKK